MAKRSCCTATRTSADFASSIETRRPAREYHATHDINIYYTHDHHYYDGKNATVTSRSNTKERLNERIRPKPNTSNRMAPLTNRLEEGTSLADASIHRGPGHKPVEDGTACSVTSSSSNSSTSSEFPERQNEVTKRRSRAKVNDTSRVCAAREWWTDDEQDTIRFFSSLSPVLVHVHDGERTVPAITISKDLGTRVKQAILAERRYKKYWTEIDGSIVETEDKKSRILKDIEDLDGKLANHDEATQDSSTPPTPGQCDRRRDLVNRAFLAREEFDRIVYYESWLWTKCNSAELACRDAWEDVGALLLPAWLRARLIQPNPIDDTRLPRGKERGITRQIVSETPATSLSRLRDNVHQYANALREARNRFEHMCHHYSSWAPWEDGTPGEFRDSVVKPAFIDMLQCEKARLEDAKRDYRQALERAWREKISDAELDLDIIDDLESVESKFLDHKNAMFIREGPINALKVWRQQNPGCPPSGRLVCPTRETGSKDDIYPWESKSTLFTDLVAKQGSGSLVKKRHEPTAKKHFTSPGEDRRDRKRRMYIDDTYKAPGLAIHARNSRSRATLTSAKHRQAGEKRHLRPTQPRVQAETIKRRRLPIASFLKKPSKTL